MKHLEEFLVDNDLYHIHFFLNQKSIFTLEELMKLNYTEIDRFNILNDIEKNKLKKLVKEYKQEDEYNEKITVCVRKRPLDNVEDDAIDVSDNTIIVNEPKLKVDLQSYTEKHTFEFDVAFDKHAHNCNVYNIAMKHIVKHVIRGGCGSVIAYGQTGTGKTYTMMEEKSGIIYKALEDIIKVKKTGHILFCEIYLGHIYDLVKNREKILLREVAGTVHLTNSSTVEFKCYDDACRIIKKGLTQRRTGVTGANRKSSRSHAIMIVNFDKKHTSAINSSNSLIFVDLAGSERGIDRRETSVETKHEGAEINKSLLALKECIRGIEQDKKHLPFRQSKLTQILKNSLIGESKTCIIATISPSYDNIEHTLNTLRYAYRIKDFKRNNQENSDSFVLKTSSEINSSFLTSNSSFFTQFTERDNANKKKSECKKKILDVLKKIETRVDSLQHDELDSALTRLQDILNDFSN